jgi:hypothetical protein
MCAHLLVTYMQEFAEAFSYINVSFNLVLTVQYIRKSIIY